MVRFQMAQSLHGLMNGLWNNWNSRGLISPLGKSASGNPTFRLCRFCAEAMFRFIGPRIGFESLIPKCSLWPEGRGLKSPMGKTLPGQHRSRRGSRRPAPLPNLLPLATKTTPKHGERRAIKMS
jgi:hypothetical protein